MSATTFSFLPPTHSLPSLTFRQVIDINRWIDWRKERKSNRKRENPSSQVHPILSRPTSLLFSIQHPFLKSIHPSIHLWNPIRFDSILNQRQSIHSYLLNPIHHHSIINTSISQSSRILQTQSSASIHSYYSSLSIHQLIDL